MKIWDGLCAGRSELYATAAPKHNEYVAIVQRIQELQGYVLGMTANVQVMPNFEEILDVLGQKLIDFDAKIKTLTPPADLFDQIETLKLRITEVDCRRAIVDLQKQVATVSRAVQNVQIEIEAALKEAKEELRSVDNRNRNALADANAAVATQMQEVGAELSRLNHLLTIKDALTKL